MAAPTGKPGTPKRVAIVVLRGGAVAGSGNVGPPLLLLLELDELELLELLELLEPPELLELELPLPPQAANVSETIAANRAGWIFMEVLSMSRRIEFLSWTAAS
jgi:hypothetical protein